MDLGRENLKLMGFLRRACLVPTLTAFRDTLFLILYSYTHMWSIIRKCVLHTCTRVTQQALVPVHTVLRVKKVGGGPKSRLTALCCPRVLLKMKMLYISSTTTRLTSPNKRKRKEKKSTLKITNVNKQVHLHSMTACKTYNEFFSTCATLKEVQLPATYT